MDRGGLKSLYPGCQVLPASDNGFDVFSGDDLVAVWRKTGAGVMADVSAEHGLPPFVAEADEDSEPAEAAAEGGEAPAAPKKKKKK